MLLAANYLTKCLIFNFLKKVLQMCILKILEIQRRVRFESWKFRKCYFNFRYSKVDLVVSSYREYKRMKRVKRVIRAFFHSCYSTAPFSASLPCAHCNDLSYPGNACRRLTLVGLLNVDKSGGGWRANAKSRGPARLRSRVCYERTARVDTRSRSIEYLLARQRADPRRLTTRTGVGGRRAGTIRVDDWSS